MGSHSFVDEPLNEYFLYGKGIRREIICEDIVRYLGPEAYAEPEVYNVRKSDISL